MTKAKRICFDRLPPGSEMRPVRFMTVGGRTRAISPKGKQWVNGSTIRIRFLGGSSSHQKMVRDIAPQWTDYANLKFEFTTDPKAEIRVAFDDADGAWSYIGLDNTRIPASAPTLNLGWVDQGVILHEFGHMLGLGHEHQSPNGGIIWNEAEVIADLSGPPNRWDEDEIRHNVLNKYAADQINGTAFDPDSIMLYAFPDEWTDNMGPTKENDELSALDRAFIASAKMYPGKGTQPDVVPLPLGTFIDGAIDAPGEEDLFSFEVKKAGKFVIETSGGADVALVLLGPNSKTKKVAEDDDGGPGLNALIKRHLLPGKYLAAVRHYSPKGRGKYQIRAKAA